MMNVSLPREVALMVHPATPCDAIRGLHVQLSAPGPGLLTLRFNLQADMSRLRVGAEVVPSRADGLWKHTCFEAFIQPGESRCYYEFNFSSTRQWAAYRFEAYREGMTSVDLSRPPEISVGRGAFQLELQATLALPAGITIGGALRAKVALTAVVEEDNGRLCYWSAKHPQGKPDFHHADGFTLEL
jgi:hypothetical protein